MNNQEKHTKFSTETRKLAVERVLCEGWSVSGSAAAIDCSRSILYRWIRRYRQAGLLELVPRSSRPKRIPRQLDAAVVQLIQMLRQADKNKGAQHQ